MLRRNEPEEQEKIKEYQFGKIYVCPSRHIVSVDGKEISLTLKEFELLCVLLSEQETVFSRSKLLDRIWGYEFDGESRTVDVHVRTLRQKLGDAKDDLDKVLFLNNTNIAGLFYRAFVNEKLLRYNFARLDYQNLLVLVPGNFQAQLGLALLNEKDKHYTEAYDGINSLIEQYPDSAMAYAARGGMEKERGMLELAEFDYAKAMELDAGNEDFAFNHVDILIQLGRKDEAYRDLKKLLDAGCQPGRLQNLISFEDQRFSSLFLFWLFLQPLSLPFLLELFVVLLLPDAYSGECEVTTTVWFNYGMPGAIKVQVADGKFRTDRVGTYGIVYESCDKTGNSAKEVRLVTVYDNYEEADFEFPDDNHILLSLSAYFYIRYLP